MAAILTGNLNAPRFEASVLADVRLFAASSAFSASALASPSPNIRRTMTSASRLRFDAKLQFIGLRAHLADSYLGLGYLAKGGIRRYIRSLG